jgi:glycosyl transferase family 20
MAALYLAADVMLVTPLRDGMNLVAKEYVACRYNESGALVLSEFTGAADELAGRRHYLELVGRGGVLELLAVGRDDQRGGHARSARAVRMARSGTLGSCSGTVTICTYSLTTSLNSESRSTSCW